MRTLSSSALIAFAFSFAACPAEEPPPLSTPEVGVIVGEVFSGDGSSLGGASVEVYGSSSKVVSVAGKQFVLEAIPKGTHDIIITSADGQQALRTQATIKQRYQTVYLPAEDTTLAQVFLQGRLAVDSGSPAGVTVYLVGGNNKQVTSTGEYGEYKLTSLPEGTVQIAYSKSGYDSIIRDMNLNIGENNAEAITLNASDVDNLSISGRARLDGENDHRGITVLLNGGEQVTSTDEKGAYHFTDLAPGVYSIRAQAAGHRSAELSAVALESSGQVHGLVDLFLAQGSDVSDTENVSEHNFELSITSPQPGQQFELGQEIVLLADAHFDGQTIAPENINWSFDDCSENATAHSLDSGNPLITTTLPQGHICLDVKATAPNGSRKNAQSTVEVLPIDVEAHIVSHQTNDMILATVPVALSAEVTTRNGLLVDDSNVQWTYRIFDSGDAFRSLCQGLDCVANFAAVDIETIIELKLAVSVADGTGTGNDTVLLHLMPLSPGVLVDADFTSVGVNLPSPTLVHGPDDGLLRIEYEIYLGQPVVLTLTQGNELAQEVSWQSDTGYLFTGPEANLSVLTLGEHNFSLTVTGESGLTGNTNIRVSVLPFTFAVHIEEPQQDPETPYFSDQGLPLKITFPIDHPYQQSFEWSKVRWFHSNLGQIATGWDTRAFGLPGGPGLIWVEVQDAVGHIAREYREYSIQNIDFTASILTPEDGVDVLEGSVLNFNASYTHSLIPSRYDEGSLVFRYYSSIQGLLRDANDNSEFAAGETASFGQLVPGHHIITLRVNLGDQFAETHRDVYVRSPGIEATLIKPDDETMYFVGDAVQFQVQESHDSEVQPLFSWYLDGQEFDASWGGYGTDATANSRTNIDLGNYDPGNVPFDDARWTEGSHEIRFFARLPEVDPNLGCVNIPGKAACIRLRIHIAPADANICPTDNQDILIDSGDVVVWSGVRRLNCRVYIRNLGKLVVQPGARILVDATDRADDRVIVLQSGTLQVGSPNATDDVIFQVQGLRAAPGAWAGVRLAEYHYNGDAIASFDHAVIRHAVTAIAASTYWNGAEHELYIRDVSVEDCNNGLSNTCANELKRTSFSNISEYALSEGNQFTNCLSQREYRGLHFTNTKYGIYLHDSGDVSLHDIVLNGTKSKGLTSSSGSHNMRVSVEDSQFNMAQDSNASAIYFSGCISLSVKNSSFNNNANAIYSLNCNDPIKETQLVVLGNRFTNNNIAVRSEKQIHAPAQIHLNSFVDNNVNIYLNSSGADAQAQGNYFGPVGDTTTTGGAALALNPGVFVNLPHLRDLFDNSSSERYVRFDNPLHNEPSTAFPLPVAYIHDPQRSQAYNAERCIPLRAESPLAGIDVTASDASGAVCHWWLDGDENSGTEVYGDADGCLDTTQTLPAEGNHHLLLSCRVLDLAGETIRTDRHETDFLVDNSAFRGQQWRSSETWSGEVYIDGDIIVPTQHNLFIEAGTRIHIAGTDRMHKQLYPRWPGDAGANNNFGLRGKIDFFVRGSLHAQGSENDTVDFIADSDSSNDGQWGGIRVLRAGELRLEHSKIIGATIATHGEFCSNDTAVLPQIYVSNSLVDGAGVMHRGAAPMLFKGNTGHNISRLFDHTKLHSGQFVVESCNFDDIGGNKSYEYMSFGNYAQNGPDNITLKFIDSNFLRSMGARRGSAIYTDYNTTINNLVISGSHFDNYDNLFYVRGNATQLDLKNSQFSNFNHMFNYSSIGDFSAVHCRFESAGEMFGTAPHDSLIIQNSRIVDVDQPFKNITVTSVLTVTKSQFENAQTVFALLLPSSSNASYQVDLSGNNYLGTTGLVLNLNEKYLSGCSASTEPYCSNGEDHNVIFAANMSGSYFDVTTEQEILDLIDEPTMPIAGRQVDYSDWVSTPLDLDIP